jgi:hypothetical protein
MVATVRRFASPIAMGTSSVNAGTTSRSLECAAPFEPQTRTSTRVPYTMIGHAVGS